MTTKTKTYSYIECDICHREDIREAKKQYIINEKCWDICFPCCEKLDSVLMFLNIGIGMNIDYRLRGGKDEG